MASTYAVFTFNGDLIDENLTAAEAAHTILIDDGQDYEIRPDKDGGFWLWYRQQVANKPWTRTLIYSAENDAEKAESDIFEQVVSANGPGPYAMGMDDWNRMLVEAEADE